MSQSELLPKFPLRHLLLITALIVGLCSCTRAGFEAESPADGTAVAEDLGAVDSAPGPDLPPSPDLGAVDSTPAPDQPTAYPPPVITNVTFKSSCVPQQRSVTISVAANDPAGGTLAMAWSSDAGGSFKGSGISTSYTPPQTNYTCSHGITVKVTSGKSKLWTSQLNTLKVTRLGDLNQDGIVNLLDQGVHAGQNGKSGCCVPTAGCNVADLNNDCLVNTADLALISANWLQSGCTCSP
jgi:hypothetical protein